MFMRRTCRLEPCAFPPEAVAGAMLAVFTLITAPPARASSDAWRALGHEPSWSLSRAGGEMTLETDFGAKKTTFPTPPPAQVDERTVLYTTTVGGAAMRLTIAKEICVDSMSGMPRPDRVSLTLGDRQFKGCGGDPASLLKGQDWIVTELAGRAAMAEPIITVTFSDDGRVSGNASCNRFGAEYRITGEGLSVAKGMSSMMACEEPVMQQEQTFLELIQGTARFSRPGDGVLVLHTADDRTMVLKKP